VNYVIVNNMIITFSVAQLESKETGSERIMALVTKSLRIRVLYG